MVKIMVKKCQNAPKNNQNDPKNGKKIPLKIIQIPLKIIKKASLKTINNLIGTVKINRTHPYNAKEPKWLF